MPDIETAAKDDERHLAQILRRWLSEKGARACDRLRTPHWVKYRLWARADRAERKRIISACLDRGNSHYNAVVELYRETELGEQSDACREAADAYALGEELDRDVANFEALTWRPWPREYPTWESLSDNEKDEIVTVYATGDRQALLQCEHRIYRYPWLVKW